MPYNPGGLFSLVASYFATPGQTIRTEQHNPPLEDIASALSNVVVRDGRAPMTGPLNMNGQVINNVAVGSSPTSVATLSQATPIGGGMDFWGTTAPPLWVFAYGQELSQTTYAALFAVLGTTYNTGGETAGNFRVPDKRGRGSAGKDDMGGVSANRLTGQPGGVNGDTLGGAGGEETQTLSVAQTPAHSHPGSTIAQTNIGTSGSPSTNALGIIGGSGATTAGAGGDFNAYALGSYAGLVLPSTALTIASQGGGAAHNNVQPSIVCNYIIYAGVA